MTTHTATVRNIQLAQGQRPTRRQTSSNHDYEAKHADRIQRRREAEQVRRNHTIIMAAVIIAVTFIAASASLAEHFLWILAMAFSAC
ncbi:MAG: hypothetical protein Q4F60_01425 [Candidatus Saccharibacteria bacterium]|nr:hypothetical protein [Candidatus Saccharibacteria bacterium]